MCKLERCHLCHDDSVLCKSHIIPSSILKRARDEGLNNRFIEIYAEGEKIVQDGPKEHLLCNDCEHIISKLEKYYIEAMHLSRHGMKIIQCNKPLAVITNIDYSKIELFLLSLIWRMGISSVPQFSNVTLGNDETIIREKILKHAPGNYHEYPIVATIPLINGNMQEGWIITHIPQTSLKSTIYHTVIAGILYSISIAQENTVFHDKWLLNETGNWAMPLMDFYKIPFLKKIVDQRLKQED